MGSRVCPHADYRIARLIFGDIEPNACPVRFTFGQNGKPFYIDGPNDTPAIKRRILNQLERRCGPGGYDYLITVSDSDRLRWMPSRPRRMPMTSSGWKL